MPDDYILEIVERAASGGAFRSGKCFACGGEPSSGPGEHVIPLWLQKRYDLPNQRLTLINGTRIPYRQLTIPCCIDCNTGFLRGIENDVIKFIQSPNFSDDAARLILGRWLSKILIGLLVKENTLLFDRATPYSGVIIPREVLEDFKQAQLLLQSARKATAFHCLHAPYPFTLYMYEIEPDEDYGPFDIITNLQGQSIAIRLGNVGLVFVNDGGLQHEVGPSGPLCLEGKSLHPAQFSEVAARVHYKATLRDATHFYSTSETPEKITINQIQVCPFSDILLDDGAVQIFRPWNDVDCANIIQKYRPFSGPPVYDPVTGNFHTTLPHE